MLGLWIYAQCRSIIRQRTSRLQVFNDRHDSRHRKLAPRGYDAWVIGDPACLSDFLYPARLQIINDRAYREYSAVVDVFNAARLKAKLATTLRRPLRVVAIAFCLVCQLRGFWQVRIYRQARYILLVIGKEVCGNTVAT